MTMLQTAWLKSVVSSMTKKYTLIYCAILVIPIILFYQLIINYSQKILETNILTNNATSVDALAKRLNTELGDVVLQLQLVSHDGLPYANLEAMQAKSREILSKSSLIRAITYVDEQRRLRFEVPFTQSADGQPYAHPLFEEVRWTLNYAVSDVLDNVRKEPSIAVAVPVLRSGNHFAGMLVAQVSREYLSEVLKIHSMASGGFGSIVDRQGIVIAATDPHEWGKDYSGYTHVKHLLTDSYGSEIEEYGGEPSILSFETMKDGWGIILGVPKRIAFEPVERLSLILTLSFLGILLLSLFLIGLGMRYLLVPVVRLTQLAQQYTVEASLREISRLKRYHSSDELGLLMRTFIRVGVSNLEKQHMLEEKERYLRNILEGIPYAIVTLDNHGVVTYFNRQFADLTGVDGKRGLGRTWAELPLHPNREEWMAIDLSSMDPMHEMERHLVDPQGVKKIIKVIVTKFFNEAGEGNGSLVVMQDVSQQKMMEALAQQREKLASIGQITTGIAHEIKNPLAILSGAAELLKEEVQEKQQMDGMIRELVEDIVQVVGRMNGIANDFLSFAKSSKDELEPVRVDQLMEKVLHLLRIKLNECRIRVIMEKQPDFPEIAGKKDKLMQVFLNLVLNSIDAMPHGGTLTIQLERHVDENTEWAAVAVRDTGVGIEKKQLDWLFNPFYSTKENGSGLGLTIARDIISEHNGIMSIQSLTEEGTVVWCKFPINSQGGGAGLDSFSYSHDRR